jgi:Lysyl oxidase
MRRERVAIALSAVGVLLVAFATQAATPVAAAGERLPDLGMARVADIRIDKGPSGQRLLRFTTTIVNVGAGPFELRATRPDSTSSAWSTTQRIYGDQGMTDVSVPIQYVYGGDGHNHWHMRDLVAGVLDRTDNGSRVGTSAKRGFCFWDVSVYRNAGPAAYGGGGCGGQSATSIVMGLSVGWGDVYSSTLPDQYIDITGLVPGRYRLTVTADNGGLFIESDETNNATWVELQIKGQGQPKIVQWGPAA